MRFIWMTISAAIGAAAMYLFDPKGGEERRNVILTQTNDAFSKTNQVLNETTQDVNARANHFMGTAKETIQQKAQEIKSQVQGAAQMVQESTQELATQAKRTRVQIQDSAEENVRSLKTQAQQAVEQVTHGDKLLTDDELLARVRMVLDNVTTNSRAIKIDVNEGYVTLNGPVEENQVQGLLGAIAGLEGIKGIDNQLQPPTFTMTEEARIPGATTGNM